jgi:2-dehydro-3-deoxyphosphogluconate aldolase/(4S)-4-hydroxy-2-oxoglutarate aldolase
LNVFDRIAAAHVVPVIRHDDGDTARAAAERFLAAGLPVIELTATTPGWASALAAVRADAPDALVGLGTVRDGETARAAVAAGAGFIVSPWPCPLAREVASAAGVALIEGGFTPAELAAATAQGIAKLFPAHAVGTGYLRSLLAVLPGARIMPTGGVAVADITSWLDAGAVAVGIGSERLAALDQLDEALARVVA